MISWFVFTVMILNLCAFLLSWQQQQQRERELRKQQEREQRRRYEEMEQLRREEERRHAEREQVHTCIAKLVFVVRQQDVTDIWTTMLGVSFDIKTQKVQNKKSLKVVTLDRGAKNLGGNSKSTAGPSVCVCFNWSILFSPLIIFPSLLQDFILL